MAVFVGNIDEPRRVVSVVCTEFSVSPEIVNCFIKSHHSAFAGEMMKLG